MKNKYFTIINRKKLNNRNKKTQNKTNNSEFKKGNTITSDYDFRYANMMLPTSQSINNPFRIRNKTPVMKSRTITQSNTDLSKLTLANEDKNIKKVFSLSTIINETDDIIQRSQWISNETIKLLKVEFNKEFIVSTKDNESCYAIESFVKISDIEEMVTQIVNFLNCFIFKQKSLRALVLDFIKDKNNT